MDGVKELDCQYVEEHDLVSQYLAGRLSEEEAEAFEKHYFGCEKCWAEVKAGEEIRAALKGGSAVAAPPSPSNVRRGPWTNWKVLALAAGLSAAVVGGSLFILGRIGATQPRSIRALTAAVKERGVSTIEARLGGFPYLPAAPVLRGSSNDPISSLRTGRVWYAAVEAQKKADESPTTENLHAAGLGHLLVGEWREAIARLEAAKERSSPNPRLLSDLSAAYLEAGRHGEGEKYFRSAYEVASLAAEPKDAPAEAFFNKALALEALHQPAASAWEAYLAHDSSSPWAAIAREHLREATRDKQSHLWKRSLSSIGDACATLRFDGTSGHIDQFRQGFRLYLEDELLPTWGENYLAGRSSIAARDLAKAACISTLLAGRNGDMVLHDSIGQLLQPGNSTSTIRALAHGYALYGQARRSYKKRRIDSALMAFRESGTTLSQKNSPFVCQVDVETAGCLYNQNALQQTLDQLEKVRGSPKRYPSVDARLRWLRGLVLLLRGHPRESLNDYQISLATFGRIGEIENTGVLHALTAECLTYLNRRDEAWLHRQQALRLLDADIDWRPLALGDAARAALTEGNPHLSIAFLDEQVRLARTSSNSPLEAEALRTRGAAQLEIRDFAAATRDLDEATQAAGRIGDDLIRERATADLLEVRGRACLAKAPTVCANSLTGALRFFQKAGNHFRIARLCLARGDHYRSIQRLDLARADYELGVDEIEMQRERLPDEDERLSYFETSAALFDRLIELLARAREVAPSLNMAERARARVLLDAITDPAYLQLGLARPLRFQDFASRLPREVTIVAFHVLPSALCVWIATPNHLSLSLTEISSAALEHEAKEFRRALENPVADFGSLLRLSRTLIGPVLEHIRPDRMIVFVPDRFLNTVPFTALIDPRDKRHLIETHAISVAPSISVLSRLFEKSGSAEDWRHQSVLAIGNPKTDETLFPRLASLPAAEAEARESATRYPGSQLLIGSRATKSAVLALAGRHQIIHFAGHAIADGLGPGRAALILAPDSTTGDSGIFYADEIASERFERLHLVVLSGCRTGVGSVRENEGVMSVARGFLAAGAPRVLATLWDVSETSASSFSRIFLRCLSEGMPPDASLRLAVKTLRSRASPGGAADWAAFQLVGLPTTRSTQLPGQTERS